LVITRCFFQQSLTKLSASSQSTFRDYVAEKTNTPGRIAEAALAHKLKDASEAAYQRGDLIEKREILMQLWGNYCYPTGEKVIQMPTAKVVS
jgi:hypothetical protein